MMTYIGSILHEHFQPIQQDMCTLLCGWQQCRWPEVRKDLFCMGQRKNDQCKPCWWGSQHPCGIPLFWLQWTNNTSFAYSASFLVFFLITWSAGAVAIPCCSFWAEALSPVVLRAASCNACAGISNQARIYTLSVFTGSWARTLRVRWAAKLKRSNWQRKVINEWFIMYHFPLDEH